MDRQIAARTKWVNLYLETKDAGYVCRKCGISRPTLRKWYRRYLQEGADGLIGKSKKPHTSPNQKINKQRTKLILDLRRQRSLGVSAIAAPFLETVSRWIHVKLPQAFINIRL
jgi:transposase-like protein